MLAILALLPLLHPPTLQVTPSSTPTLISPKTSKEHPSPSCQFSPNNATHTRMEMLLTRSSKKILLTAGLVLIIFYLMYRGKLAQATSQEPLRLSTLYCIGTSSETVVDCPKTESMSKKTSMISSVWFFTFYDCANFDIFRMVRCLSMTANPH